VTFFLPRLLMRLVYPAGSIRQVRRGPVKGMRFCVRPGIMGFRFAWGLDAWKQSMNWDWFLTRLRPGMVIYDIGANRGQMAMLFAGLVGPTGFVASFEPVPLVFQDLLKNLTLNALDRVKPVCAAVSDVEGNASFIFSEHTSLMGKLADCDPGRSPAAAQTIQVKTVRLDDLVGSELPPPQFMKIDVEGGAHKVLAGAQRILSEFRPEIYMELHGPEEQQAVKDLIQGKRYLARLLSGQAVADPTAGWFDPLWCVPAEKVAE
jgi:FkbM family methyltransferase